MPPRAPVRCTSRCRSSTAITTTRTRRQRANLDLAKLDISERRRDLHTDIPRLRQGGVGAQFWSVYVPTTVSGADAVKQAIEQIDIVHRMTRRYPEAFELALTPTKSNAFQKRVQSRHSWAWKAATRSTRRSGTQDDVQAGGGYMTLTHSRNVPWADSCY